MAAVHQLQTKLQTEEHNHYSGRFQDTVPLHFCFLDLAWSEFFYQCNDCLPSRFWNGRNYRTMGPTFCLDLVGTLCAVLDPRFGGRSLCYMVSALPDVISFDCRLKQKTDPAQYQIFDCIGLLCWQVENLTAFQHGAINLCTT